MTRSGLGAAGLAQQAAVVTERVRAEALAALGGGEAAPMAEFRFDIASGSWWWSAGMYALHGFADGGVQPSTELLLAHKQPDDLAQTQDTLARVLATGEPFCCRHRIVDTAGVVHVVLSVGEGVKDEAGAVATVRGFFIDLTQSLREITARESRLAVSRSAESRADIEQAKGILIAVYGLSPDAAFELLVWCSQHTNTKVRALAAELVGALSASPPGMRSAAQRVRDVLRLLPPQLG